MIAVVSDSGMMGGKLAHEYMYLTPFGEDTLLLCDDCGYSANRQIAVFQKTPKSKEALLDIEKVATPEAKTIADLASYLRIDDAKTAKAVFMVAHIPDSEISKDKFIFAITRGDMELNETKLVNALKANAIRPALEEEIEMIGAVPGYASPVGLPKTNDYMEVVIVVDDLIPLSTNLVAGANEMGYHLLNVNYGRDYKADIVVDITAARDGDGCPRCGNPMHTMRGVEVGNIFQLGTRYSDSMGCTFQDKDGTEKPVIMGSYGIGSGRLLASIAEENNDNYGLIWPISVAPYQVHLVLLPGKKDGGQVENTATKIYNHLKNNGIEVLYDDRADSPGVKFNDADLIGLPIRVTVSARNLAEGVVELKRRDQDKSQKQFVKIEEILGAIKEEIAYLHGRINSGVVLVPYKE